MSGRNRARPSDYWLGLAKEDLAGAMTLEANVTTEPRLSVGLAAQAAEKALKAVLASSGFEPPRTHDLVALAHRSGAARHLTVSEHDLRRLSDAHEHARYPQADEASYDREEASALVRVATTIVTELIAALDSD